MCLFAIIVIVKYINSYMICGRMYAQVLKTFYASHAGSTVTNKVSACNGFSTVLSCHWGGGGGGYVN